MGINNLMPLIKNRAPQAITQIKYTDLKNKAVAIDASMQMYKLVIGTQTIAKKKGEINEIKDNKGVLTGHLLGMLYKSVKLVSYGIKPIWVFDGKPPELKAAELEKRKEMKEKAEEERKDAEEKGDFNRAKQMAGRSVRITPSMVEDAKKLVRLMGAVAIDAPGEAEA